MYIYYFNCSLNVSRCLPKGVERLCQKISRAVVYDHPQTRQAYLPIFHHYIYADHLDYHLQCPMQCRIHVVNNNENPTFLLKNPTDSNRVIVVEEPKWGASLVIPLFINGVTSYFICQKPTRSKYEDGRLPKLISLRRLQTGIYQIETMIDAMRQKFTSEVPWSMRTLQKRGQIWLSIRYLLG